MNSKAFGLISNIIVWAMLVIGTVLCWGAMQTEIDPITKQGVGSGCILSLYHLPIFYDTLKTADRFFGWYIKVLSAMMIWKAVEPACISEAFQCFFIYRSLVDTLNKVKNIFEWPVLFSFMDDAFNSSLANSF